MPIYNELVKDANFAIGPSRSKNDQSDGADDDAARSSGSRRVSIN